MIFKAESYTLGGNFSYPKLEVLKTRYVVAILSKHTKQNNNKNKKVKMLTKEPFFLRKRILYFWY